MEVKFKSLTVVVIVLMSTFYLASMTLQVNVKASTLFVGGTGPGNYTTIQSAIDNAVPGDTIYVFNGVYRERIEVNKTLSLVGEDRNETIIDGMGLGHVVNVTADSVNITGFKVLHNDEQSKAGIHLQGVQGCFIANNNVSSNDEYSIYLVSSDNNTVANNVLWENMFGVHLVDSHFNDIVRNMVSSGTRDGITLLDSDNNTVANNRVSRNHNGIALYFSSDNTLVNNTAMSNRNDGIYLRYSNSNEVINNTLGSNNHGIHIRTSDNNTATNNYAWDNEYVGIALLLSHGNTVADNVVTLNSQYGIRLTDSKNNTIHHNNIINNSLQASDDLDTNQWDDGYPSGGNYWSDYAGVDVFSGPNQDIPGGDGMGDTPYVIDADSEDKYPLVALVPSPPLSPLNLSAFARDKQIALTWNSPSFNGSLPITNYRIYRGIAPGSETYYAQIGNFLNYLDSGLTNGQLYCYKVSAVNGVGEGPLSNEACATPTTTPGAPVILQADLSGNAMENVTVKWSLSSDDGNGQNSVVGYSIIRGTTYDVNAAGYQPVTFVPSGTIEFNDDMAGDGDPSNHFYQICAVDLNNLTNCSLNQAGKFTRSLLNGPNLVSIPLVQSDESIETVLQTVKWDKAWTYDSSAQKWKSHMLFKPYKGELEEVNSSMGIWVNVTEQSNLTVAGIVPSSTSIYLQAGWNLVGFPSFNGTYAVSDLKATVGVKGIEGFEALTPPYFLRTLTDGDVLQTGFGYWIRMSTDGLWTVISS
ncbi:MAG: NosD domain-containing protein [Thermoplasmata archaeon]